MQASSPGRSAVAFLSDGHLQLARLSSELAESTGPLEDLTEAVSAAVTRHLSAEQRFLYPTIRSLLPEGDRIAEQELDADEQILRHLTVLRSTPTHTLEFRRLATQLKDDLIRHARWAATEIYPRLMAMSTEDDLIRLGARIAEAVRGDGAVPLRLRRKIAPDDL